VWWYFAYSGSYRDIEERMLERGIGVDQFTIQRWVIDYLPFLENEFRKNHKRKVRSS
jgi:transposase-like protein